MKISAGLSYCSHLEVAVLTREIYRSIDRTARTVKQQYDHCGGLSESSRRL